MSGDSLRENEIVEKLGWKICFGHYDGHTSGWSYIEILKSESHKGIQRVGAFVTCGTGFEHNQGFEAEAFLGFGLWIQLELFRKLGFGIRYWLQLGFGFTIVLDKGKLGSIGGQKWS